NMQNQADAITNIYSELEDRIFDLIIKMMLKKDLNKVNKENVMLWQIQQLNYMGVLNKKVINLLASYTNSTQGQIEKLIKDNGIQI
ncbi:phage minor capsid protein, partial [Enterococcus faecium]